jgi:hypothetical protein
VTDQDRAEIVRKARELGDSTTLSSYVDRAVRTECPYAPVIGRAYAEAGTGDVGLRLAHMSLGVSNEVGELLEGMGTPPVVLEMIGPNVKLNIREELGDLTWYCAGVCSVLGLSFNKVTTDEPYEIESETDFEMVIQQLIIGSGRIAEQVKRHVFYGKEAEEERVQSGVSNVVGAIQSIAAFFEFDLIKILQDNIAKLAARFPDKFTEVAAIDRDKTTEYDAMES